jgi:hypothetical protein
VINKNYIIFKEIIGEVHIKIIWRGGLEVMVELENESLWFLLEW